MTRPSSSILVIIQARMGSQRLPGKILTPIAGKPLLQHLCDALRSRLKPEQILIATSTHSANDAVAEFCTRTRTQIFRGHETNVALRFQAILKKHQPDYFVRISADSPLIDVETIQKAVVAAQTGEFDLVTTVGGGFPSGSNVEVLSAQAYEKAYPSFSKPEHFEHVTAYFYENKDAYRISVLLSPIPSAERYKLSVDTPEDLALVTRIYEKMKKPHYEYSLAEKCSIYDEVRAQK